MGIIDVVYNACNNELVRTKTLVKNAIVVIDAAPFRQWYESHYAQPLARKKGAKLTDADEAVLNRKMSKKTARKYAELQKTSEVEKPLLDQFGTGRVLAAISSGRTPAPYPQGCSRRSCRTGQAWRRWQRGHDRCRTGRGGASRPRWSFAALRTSLRSSCSSYGSARPHQRRSAWLPSFWQEVEHSGTHTTDGRGQRRSH